MGSGGGSHLVHLTSDPRGPVLPCSPKLWMGWWSASSHQGTTPLHPTKVCRGNPVKNASPLSLAVRKVGCTGSRSGSPLPGAVCLANQMHLGTFVTTSFWASWNLHLDCIAASSSQNQHYDTQRLHSWHLVYLSGFRSGRPNSPWQ